jgi:hypothetical protein
MSGLGSYHVGAGCTDSPVLDTKDSRSEHMTIRRFRIFERALEYANLMTARGFIVDLACVVRRGSRYTVIVKESK